MNTVSKEVMAKIDAQYVRNMDWLKITAPALVPELEQQTTRSVNINVDDNGQIIFRISSPEFGSAAFAQQELWQAASVRIDEMAGAQRSAWQLMPDNELKSFLEQGATSASFLDEDVLLREYGEAYFSSLHRRLHEAYRFGRGEKPYTLTPQFGEDFIPAIVVIGAVEGWQLEKMVERWNVRHLILVDTYPAGMKLSLCFTDFPKLAERFAREGRRLTLLMDPNLQALARKIADELQEYWPPHFLHGLVWFNGIHVKGDLAELNRHFDACVRSANEGWGFFEDELAALRHTHFNLEQGLPVCHEARPLPPGCTAIICGAGPSLDETIEFIKANRANAVVFSCGSALRVLYKAGIVPDFQIETERMASLIDFKRHEAPPEFLKQLRVIAPSLVYPEISNIFGEVWLLAKASDISGRTFLGGLPLFHTGPSVTNCALNLCMAFGFSDIVLCGMDCGWLDDGQQHASDAVYDHDIEVSLTKTGQVLKAVSSYLTDTGLTAKGNFRDTVSTDPVLDQVRMAAERVIAVTKGVRVFNTADGARIEGAFPCRVDALHLTPSPLTNEQIVSAMYSGFRPVAADRLAQCEPLPSQCLKAFINDIRARIPADVTSRKALLWLMTELRVDRAPSDPSRWIGWAFISGSLAIFLHYLHIDVASLEDDAAAAAVVKQGHALLLEMLNTAERVGEHWQTWPTSHRPVFEHY